jgi:DNA repair protein RadC
MQLHLALRIRPWLRIRRVTLADAGAPYGEAIREPDDVARIAQALIGDAAEERFIVLVLDIKNRVLGFTEAGRGCVDSCPVDPRTVFRTAIALGASGIVASHCHPSGDPRPSAEDIALTKRLKAAGDLLGIQLLDHVIVTDTATVSMLGRGDL